MLLSGLDMRGLVMEKFFKWLLKQDTYGLSKPAKRTFPRSSIYISGIDAQWSMDPIDFVNIGGSNDDYRYILVIEDIFSCYMWTTSLKGKIPQKSWRL